MREFLHDANAPLVYFNLLAALPKTPLWDRMLKEGRLLDADGDTKNSESLLACLATNVRYKLDNEQVIQMLLDTVADVYAPHEVYRRNLWNAENVYGKQIQGAAPTSTREVKFLIRFAAGALARVVTRIGLRAEPEERREFWKFVRDVVRLRREGRLASVLEVLLRVTPNAHHLITWGKTLALNHAKATRSFAPPRARGQLRPTRPSILVLGDTPPEESGAVPFRLRTPAAAAPLAADRAVG
jgi:hypothetical protein